MEWKKSKYDLIYLDIQMKGKNGISVAKSIREVDQNVLIIYVSAYEKYVQELFEVDATAFLHKPIDEMKFERYFLHAYEKISEKAVYFKCQYKQEEIKVQMGEIVYFESRGRKIHIRLTDNKEEIFNGKLDEIEEQVKNSKVSFLRIHQSFLVNYHQIRGCNKTQMRMKDGNILSISEEHQKTISKEYSLLLGGEVCE
ncbi:MAG: LytTR family DNA-binding domain-containing protein [Lachnospiraceae bacterium]